MLKLSYLIVLGCAVGAITAAVCGHLMFWFPVGALLGLASHNFRSSQRSTADHAANQPARLAAPNLAAWRDRAIQLAASRLTLRTAGHAQGQGPIPRTFRSPARSSDAVPANTVSQCRMAYASAPA